MVLLTIKHGLLAKVRQSEVGTPVRSTAVRYEKGAKVACQAGKKGPVALLILDQKIRYEGALRHAVYDLCPGLIQKNFL